MRTNQENLKLIASYLAGHLSQSEREGLEQWIGASPENQKIFKEASRIWENSGTRLTMPDYNSDLLWNELKSKMDNSRKIGKVEWFIHRNKTVLQIAASIILVAMVIYLIPPQPEQM